MKTQFCLKDGVLKSVKVITILGFALLAFLLGVALNQHKVAMATGVSREVIPGVRVSRSDILSSVNNGIEVKVTNFRKEVNLLSMDVCYTMLDNSDWTIGKVSLKYDQMDISDHSTSLIERQPPSSGQPGYRCDVLSFEVPNSDLKRITVDIQTLKAEPRENEFCTSYLKKLNDKLTEQGIVAGCEQSEGAYGLKLVKKPDFVSQSEAEAKIFSEDYYSSKGPWKFSADLK